MNPNWFEPLPESEFDPVKAAHLLRRAGFGGTWNEAETLAAVGLDTVVDQLVGFAPDHEESPPDCGRLPSESPSQFAARLQRLEPEERMLERQFRRREEREKINLLKMWWLRRMLDTAHPLGEKMTLFWHSHFASSFEDKIETAFPLWQQNTTFRRLALAPFGDLLRAVIRDPAMLVWLDNAASHKDRPNENFARELMELFSLGVNQYSERDVMESARALTGYTVDRETWQFVFREETHDTGEKVFMEKRGAWNGEEIVGILCKQPALPRFLAGKLLRYFVRHDPPDALIAEAAARYAASGMDHRKFLATLFRARGFYEPDSVGCLVKSPVDLALGAIRAMRISMPEDTVLLGALSRMGQDLFFPPDVDGWPGGMTWINSNLLLVRYNFANYLIHGVAPDDFRVFDPAASGSMRRQFVERQRGRGAAEWSPQRLLLDSEDGARLRGADRIVDHYLADFLQRPVPDSLRAEYVRFAETDAAGGRRTLSVHDRNFDERIKGLIHLMMSSPEYQLC